MDESISRADIEMQMQRTDTRTKWGKERVGWTEGSGDTYT